MKIKKAVLMYSKLLLTTYQSERQKIFVPEGMTMKIPSH